MTQPREGKGGITSPIEKHSCKVLDVFQHSGAGPHDSVHLEDPLYENHNESELIKSSCSISSPNIEVVENETNFYSEKTVMEIELPEMVVCLKHGNYHIAKDISIDEGACSHDEALAENDDSDQRNFSSSNNSTTNESGELTKEMTDGAIFILDGLESSAVNGDLISGFDKGEATLCSDCVLGGRGYLEKDNQVVSSSPIENIIFKKLPPLQGYNNSMEQANSLKIECNNDQQQSKVGRNSQQKIEQDPFKEFNSTEETEPCADKDDDQTNRTKKNSATGKVEVGIITFDFGAGPVDITGREGSEENTDFQHSGRALNGSQLDEMTIDVPTASNQSSFVHHNHGESNFAGLISLSGPIPNSGHIPYSGSISLRSDSSTTSAHSFAFPILQSELNSSPVRMAKADRRHLRKHQGWRAGLLCCRF